MDFACMVGYIRIRRNNLCSSFIERDVASGDVLAEAGTRDLQADAIFEAEIDYGKLALPVFIRDIRQAISNGQGLVRAVAVCDSVQFIPDALAPRLIVGEVK